MERNDGARGDGHKPGTLRQKAVEADGDCAPSLEEGTWSLGGRLSTDSVVRVF